MADFFRFDNLKENISVGNRIQIETLNGSELLGKITKIIDNEQPSITIANTFIPKADGGFIKDETEIYIKDIKELWILFADSYTVR